jgi:Ran GTPase-activating protein (RanGAP) involved in mRNA processing and transport
MEALCQSVVNTSVVYLYVKGNRIGNQGAIALATLLRVDACQIEEVYLGSNQIESARTIALASCLKSNKRVSKIYLEGNAMGLEGANAFSGILEPLNGDTGLKHLLADNNQLGKDGSKRLTMALNGSTAI